MVRAENCLLAMQFIAEIAAKRAADTRSLECLLGGRMRSWKRIGGIGMVDTTQESIVRLEGYIQQADEVVARFNRRLARYTPNC